MDVVQITKHNEVHDRIVCDPDLANEISDFFTFDVSNAKFTPAGKSGFWDGKIRIFNKMNGLLPCGLRTKLEQFCKDRDYGVEYTFDVANVEFSLKEAWDFIETLKIPEKYKPRDYQVEAFVTSVREGRLLLLSPTGSGKSMLIYLLTMYFGVSTLIVVPRKSLVHQLAGDFKDYGYDEAVHKIFGGQDKDTEHEITISTWQSIAKQSEAWFAKYQLFHGDEAHLFKAKSLTTILGRMKQCVHKYGFTGTLDDVQCHVLVLQGLFGRICKVATTAELIEQKYLADFDIKALILSYPDTVRKSLTKATYQDEMSYIFACAGRNRFIKNLALSLKGNTILLFQRIETHGKLLYDLIKTEAGDRKVYYIHGGVDVDIREEIRKIVETDTDAIICASTGTFSFGVNIVNLSNVIFASPSKGKIQNLQSIGRALRRSATKTTATLYDIADDMSWKKKNNYTLTHFILRMKIYAEEKHPYKVYKIAITP